MRRHGLILAWLLVGLLVAVIAISQHDSTPDEPTHRAALLWLLERNAEAQEGLERELSRRRNERVILDAALRDLSTARLTVTARPLPLQPSVSDPPRREP